MIGLGATSEAATAAGGFDVLDEDGFFLAGDLFDTGFTEDMIELQFDNLSGSGAGSFRTSVLALVVFDDPLGADPFASPQGGDSFGLGASITISNVTSSAVAPITLPAGLPLLLTGLGGIALLRRRRKA